MDRNTPRPEAFRQAGGSGRPEVERESTAITRRKFEMRIDDEPLVRLEALNSESPAEHLKCCAGAVTTELHQKQSSLHPPSRRRMPQLRLASSGRGGKTAPVLASFVRKPYSNETMRVFGRMGVVALMLVSFLTPAMACLIPGTSMTAQERACCRRMGSECGEVGMPAMHSCCQRSLPGIRDKVVETKSAAVYPFALVAVTLTSFEVVIPAPSTYARMESADSSLFGSPPSSVSILRI